MEIFPTGGDGTRGYGQEIRRDTTVGRHTIVRSRYTIAIDFTRRSTYKSALARTTVPCPDRRAWVDRPARSTVHS